jgi:hypothetical protein
VPPQTKKIIAFGLIAIGGIDLLFGNTNQPMLPDFLANHLTQQVDGVLIGVGILLLFWF